MRETALGVRGCPRARLGTSEGPLPAPTLRGPRLWGLQGLALGCPGDAPTAAVALGTSRVRVQRENVLGKSRVPPVPHGGGGIQSSSKRQHHAEPHHSHSTATDAAAERDRLGGVPTYPAKGTWGGTPSPPTPSTSCAALGPCAEAAKGTWCARARESPREKGGCPLGASP